MAQYAQEPGLLLEAHYALGVALLFSGAFAAADTHLENGLALYDPQQPRRQASFTASIPAWGVAAISPLRYGTVDIRTRRGGRVPRHWPWRTSCHTPSVRGRPSVLRRCSSSTAGM